MIRYDKKMKLLLIDFPNPKSPRALRPHHIEKVKKLLKRGDELVIALSAKETDADIIAGFPNEVATLGMPKNVRWIHSFSAGVNKFLTPELVKSPIIVSNSAGIHAIPIAEHVLGMLLMFARLFHITLYNQEQKRWEPQENIQELNGKTILIVGLGHIGNEVARLCHAFGAHVLAITKTKKKKTANVDELKTLEHLDSFLDRADFVVLCLPYTKDTHHLFDIKKFTRMKPSAVIINIGRGSVINEHDLIYALKQKIIAGAGLDVTEIEPLPKTNPLWEMENVILTPHHSGLSEKYMDRAIEVFIKNLKAFRSNKNLPSQIDKEKGY